MGSLLPVFCDNDTATDQLVGSYSGVVTTEKGKDWLVSDVQIQDFRVECIYSVEAASEHSVFGVALNLRANARSGKAPIRAFVRSDGTWGDGYFPQDGGAWITSGLRKLEKGKITTEGKNTFEIVCRESKAAVKHNGVYLGDISMREAEEAGTIQFGIETDDTPVSLVVHRLSVFQLAK